MTVAELIEILKTKPQDLRVWGWDDGSIQLGDGSQIDSSESDGEPYEYPDPRVEWEEAIQRRMKSMAEYITDPEGCRRRLLAAMDEDIARFLKGSTPSPMRSE